jgi:hypothetical protein
VVVLDVGECFDVPERRQLEGAVDLIKAGDQIVVERAGATGHPRVGDVAQVVADVAPALGLAAGIRGVVGPLELGGTGELGVDGLGGEFPHGLQRVGGTLLAAEDGVELGVAEVAALRVGGGSADGRGRAIASSLILRTPSATEAPGTPRARWVSRRPFRQRSSNAEASLTSVA